MIPIALSMFLWDRVFKRKNIAFHVDNLAVVTVLDSKSSKYPRVMHLLRFIVDRSMMGHFHMKAFHILSANNCVADAISRGQFQKFKELTPEANTFSTAVPMEFWSLLNSTLSI
jgi:heptaprenylglyceryl phosphate synthase